MKRNTPLDETLVSWIGDMDYAEVAQQYPKNSPERTLLAKELVSNWKDENRWLSDFDRGGAISPFLGSIRHRTKEGSPFSRIVALSNRGAEANELFRRAMIRANGDTGKAFVFAVALTGPDGPMDFGMCYSFVEKRLADLGPGRYRFNLSSGTSAMVSALLLAAKTSPAAQGAAFLVAYKADIHEQDIPFDIGLTLRRERRRMDRTIIGDADHDILGDSPAIVSAKRMAKRISSFGANVLLLGPNGCGKELFAKTIHEESGRKGKLVPVNCGTFGSSLDMANSRLFGHRKGAYTGAIEDRPGAFELADGGTLFLDEIGDLPLETQADLLRTINPVAGEPPTRRHVTRIGEDDILRTPDVRIVAATNKPIERMVSDGTFREDLFYRLQDFVIVIPSLDERKEDISTLARFFLHEINEECSSGGEYRPKTFAPDVLPYLSDRSWPGNVRELRAAVRRTAILCDGANLSRMDFERCSPRRADHKLPSEEEFSLDAVSRRLQARYISVAREIAGGNDAMAARMLGFKSRQALEVRWKSVTKSSGRDDAKKS